MQIETTQHLKDNLIAKSPGPPILSMLHAHFSACNIESWNGPGDETKQSSLYLMYGTRVTLGEDDPL